MIVPNMALDAVITDIFEQKLLGYDSETYGTRFNDRMFSFIVATDKREYYFNFNKAPDHLGTNPPAEYVLDRREVFKKLNKCFFKGIWAAHNAQFDNQKIRLETFAYPVHCHCTMSTERILRNDFMDYSLAKVAPRYGLEKDATVDKYITKHGLKTRVLIPGKKVMSHIPHFDLVPLEIMVKYACNDARIHREIAKAQRTALGLSE